MPGPHGDVSRRAVLGGIAGGLAAAALPVAALPVGAGPAFAGRTEDEREHGGARLRNRMTTDHAWAEFMAGQDLVWRRMPRTWYEGPFLGNGFLGSIAYREPNGNALRFTVQHSAVQDHRPDVGGSDWGLARLPVGHLTLEPVGRITDVDLRLDLWNAELRGTVTTDRGTLAVRVAIHAERPVLFATVRPSEGERGYRWVFHPERAISPRIVREPPPAGYVENPSPATRDDAEVHLVVQPLVAGGQTVTAYRTDGPALYLSVAHSFPEATAESQALTAVRQAARRRLALLFDEHRGWWHRFYRRSFVSVPDQQLQSFYWIQLYKLASGARAEAPVMATTGPWLEPTPWPGVWWNLNVQLEYWLLNGSNHRELDAVSHTLGAYRQILIDGLRPEFRDDCMGMRRSTDMFGNDNGFVAVPGRGAKPEVGNLTWALHNVWLTYRHSMDDTLLRDPLFPLLRRAVNYYLKFLYVGDDGKLHLPLTFSPEYGSAPDCNYDLALIRWACQTLLYAVGRLGIDDPLVGRWREVLDKLVDFPVDANGFMVGAGEPFAKSHRHYSHMLSVYPLYLVNADQPEHRDLIERSLRHWIGFEGALRGYSFSGAASIVSQLGRGDEALGYLGELIRRFVQANTMYYEAGPVVETPLSAAQSMLDMLVQSWGGVIRVFPAVPAAWADVTVHDLRTEGAFEVSAVRTGGVTRFVRVASLAGEPCRLRHGMTGPVTVRASCGRDPAWRDVGNGTIEIDLRRGDEVVVFPVGTRPDLVIAPVPVNVPAPPWGLPPLPPPGRIVPVDLSAVYDNDAISTIMFTGDGDFDGTGMTYPDEEFPQTGQLTDDGITFLLGNGADGSRNNVVAAGQTLSLPPGTYGRLHVLGAADKGNANTTATLTYGDGTTAPVRLALTDWATSPAYGETEAIRTTRRHTRTAVQDIKVAVFHQVLAVDPARELRSVTLPTPTGSRPHIFALTLEQPPSTTAVPTIDTPEPTEEP